MGTETVALFDAANLPNINGSCKTQDDMHIAQEFFRNTFYSAPVGMVITDIDGRYTRVNGAMCNITGYCEDELLAMRYVDITHPDDVEPNTIAWHALLNEQASSFQMEKQYVRKDGRVLWVDLSVSTMRNESGQITNFVGVISNITDRKESALNLTNSRQQLRELAAYQVEMLERNGNALREKCMMNWDSF